MQHLEMNNVALIGLGAIGVSFGQKIQEIYPNRLTVIADEKRAARYRQQPFTVNRKPVTFHFETPEEADGPADLLLVAVKHHHLSEALDSMAPWVGEHTVILSLMNGITSEEIIGQRFGMDKMLYGVCVGIDAVREGDATSYQTMGKIYYGEKTNTVLSERVQAVKTLFDATDIPYEIPEDMLKAMWWKFMANVGINQPSAVLEANYGAFQTIPELKALMIDTMKEVLTLANVMGIKLTLEDIEKFHPIIDTFSPEGKTSMLQDIKAGRKTEVEMLAGTMMELGEKYGVTTPINRMLFDLIRIKEKMNR